MLAQEDGEMSEMLQAGSEKAQQEAVRGGQNEHSGVWAEENASRCKDPPCHQDGVGAKKTKKSGRSWNPRQGGKDANHPSRKEAWQVPKNRIGAAGQREG